MEGLRLSRALPLLFRGCRTQDECVGIEGKRCHTMIKVKTVNREFEILGEEQYQPTSF